MYNAHIFAVATEVAQRVNETSFVLFAQCATTFSTVCYFGIKGDIFLYASILIFVYIHTTIVHLLFNSANEAVKNGMLFIGAQM